MQGPRTPQSHELSKLVDFLTNQLRDPQNGNIAEEYPTALTLNNIHNMSIITDDEKIVSHALMKTVIIKTPTVIYKVGTIGSVVTDPEYRQRGLGSQNIEHCLKMAEEQDCDFVVLWTDQYDFYRRMGFELVGYEHSYVIESSPETFSDQIRFIQGSKISPEALLKLYSQHTVHGVRTLEDFRQFLKIPNSNVYTAWSPQNQLLAYAVEGKGADLTNYIHEWSGQTDALIQLFQYMYKTKQQPMTVMVPHHSKNLQQKLATVSSLSHEGFFGMIKLIKKENMFAKIKKAFRAEGVDQIVFDIREGVFVFGVGTDLYTLEDEKMISQIIFGPVNFEDLGFLSPDVQKKMAQVLPLPLWLWGWDSI